MEFREAIIDFEEQPFTRQILLDILKDYKRPYDKIAELVKQGYLILVKRGIYVPGANLKITGPDPLLLANHLLGPSYISLETALSYWGLIPERVFEVSSVTTQKNKTYKTSLGRYTYTQLPLPYYSFGIRQVELTPKQVVLIASPEKALCDKIITTAGVVLRSIKQVKAYLINDLRIEKEALRNLNKQEIAKWLNDAPKKSSLNLLLKMLEEL